MNKSQELLSLVEGKKSKLGPWDITVSKKGKGFTWDIYNTRSYLRHKGITLHDTEQEAMKSAKAAAKKMSTPADHI